MDNCEICKGAKGGVLGNENIVEGKVMCDYCSADYHGPYLIGGTTTPSPGEYNIAVEGVKTLVALWAKFDGTNWINLPHYGTGRRIYFYTSRENIK